MCGCLLVPVKTREGRGYMKQVLSRKNKMEPEGGDARGWIGVKIGDYLDLLQKLLPPARSASRIGDHSTHTVA